MRDLYPLATTPAMAMKTNINTRIDPNQRVTDYSNEEDASNCIVRSKVWSRKNSKSHRISANSSFQGAGGRLNEFGENETFDPTFFSQAVLWAENWSLKQVLPELAAFSCKQRFELTEADVSMFRAPPGAQRILLRKLALARIDYAAWRQLNNNADPLGVDIEEPVWKIPLNGGFEHVNDTDGMIVQSAAGLSLNMIDYLDDSDSSQCFAVAPAMSESVSASSYYTAPDSPDDEEGDYSHSSISYVPRAPPSINTFQAQHPAPAAPETLSSPVKVQTKVPALQAGLSFQDIEDGYATGASSGTDEPDSEEEERKARKAYLKRFKKKKLIHEPASSQTYHHNVLDHFVSAQDVRSFPSAAGLSGKVVNDLRRSPSPTTFDYESHFKSASTYVPAPAYTLPSHPSLPNRPPAAAIASTSTKSSAAGLSDQVDREVDSHFEHLTKQMTLLVRAAGPSKEEEEFRTATLQRVQALVAYAWHGATAEITGSTMKGLYTRDSDLDICIRLRFDQNIPTSRQREELKRFKNIIWGRRHGLPWLQRIDDWAIERARVPVLQLQVHKPYKRGIMKVDLVIRSTEEYESDAALWQLEGVAMQVDQKAVIFLTILFKTWLQWTKLGLGVTGGFTGTCALAMCCHFIVQMGELRELENQRHGPEKRYANLFIQMLEYYGRLFDNRMAISMTSKTLYPRTGFAESEQGYGEDGFGIVDPRDNNRNLARGVRQWINFRKAIREFQNKIRAYLQNPEVICFCEVDMWKRYLADPWRKSGAPITPDKPIEVGKKDKVRRKAIANRV